LKESRSAHKLDFELRFEESRSAHKLDFELRFEESRGTHKLSQNCDNSVNRKM